MKDLEPGLQWVIMLFFWLGVIVIGFGFWLHWFPALAVLIGCSSLWFALFCLSRWTLERKVLLWREGVDDK